MKIVAVTSCPTGIAHTYMAAEALEEAARQGGHTISVETQGAAGASPIAAGEAVTVADLDVGREDDHVGGGDLVGGDG